MYNGRGPPVPGFVGNGAGPLPLPLRTSSKSGSGGSSLAQPSLSRWNPNPVSLPPRMAPHPQPNRPPSQVPTVPPRNSSASNGISDNWVDLEELYRWLQELEDTKIEPRETPHSDEDNTGKKGREEERMEVTN